MAAEGSNYPGPSPFEFFAADANARKLRLGVRVVALLKGSARSWGAYRGIVARRVRCASLLADFYLRSCFVAWSLQ